MATEREPLSRTAILNAALEVAEEEGLTSLTMRKLGQVLGVEAMSLYHYVNGREDLLEGMVDAVVGEVTVPGNDDLGPVDGWQAFLLHVGHDVRATALRHPNIFPLMATRPPSAPWLRPPFRSLQLVDDFLSGLIERGLSDKTAVHVYKAFTTFLLGSLLLEVAVGTESTTTDEPFDVGGAEVPHRSHDADFDSYQVLGRLRDDLTRHDPHVDFEEALEALLDRLDRELTQ